MSSSVADSLRGILSLQDLSDLFLLFSQEGRGERVVLSLTDTMFKKRVRTAGKIDTMTKAGFKLLLKRAGTLLQGMESDLIDFVFMRNLGYSKGKPRFELTFDQFLDALVGVASAKIPHEEPDVALREVAQAYIAPLFAALFGTSGQDDDATNSSTDLDGSASVLGGSATVITTRSGVRVSGGARLAMTAQGMVPVASLTHGNGGGSGGASVVGGSTSFEKAVAAPVLFSSPAAHHNVSTRFNESPAAARPASSSVQRGSPSFTPTAATAAAATRSPIASPGGSCRHPEVPAMKKMMQSLVEALDELRGEVYRLRSENAELKAKEAVRKAEQIIAAASNASSTTCASATESSASSSEGSSSDADKVDAVATAATATA